MRYICVDKQLQTSRNHSKPSSYAGYAMFCTKKAKKNPSQAAASSHSATALELPAMTSAQDHPRSTNQNQSSIMFNPETGAFSNSKQQKIHKEKWSKKVELVPSTPSTVQSHPMSKCKGCQGTG